MEKKPKKKILITGTAGFIGFHLVKKLQEENVEIIGLDNINHYYEVNLKFARLRETGINVHDIEYNKLISSESYSNYRFVKLNLEDSENIDTLFKEEQFDYVCNLAAQAGVRYSLKNPYAYIDSNINGFMNILEGCRNSKVKHLVYASSSSVYGLNEQMPFSTHDNVDHPLSLYAATKKSNELMAHTYSHLYGIPTTGLRFFTVYGPYGRPDMALFIFTKAILNNEPINIFNHGKMKRDFTYIDDIVEGIKRVVEKPAKPNQKWTGKDPDPSSSEAPFKIYNIGNNSPVELLDFVEAIEDCIGKKAKRNYMPIQPGDVEKTWADVEDLTLDFNYNPNMPIKKGVKNFVEWYRWFYDV